MSLKTTKKSNVWVAAFVALGLVAIACGDDGDDDDDAGGTTAGTMGGGTGGTTGGTVAPATRDWSGTLVQVLAQDTNAPIKRPHKLVVLDNETGEPLEGGKWTTMTSSTDGKWELKAVPMAKPIAFHMQGNDEEMTYDAMTINVTATTAADPLSRISAAGTASLAEMAAGYVGKPENAGLSIGVYHVVNQQRMAVIGCVKAVLDDSEDKTKAADLRYVTAGGLPSASQPMTEASRGAMLFGNIPKGKHTLKFTVDNGATYFGMTEINITKSRSEATSSFKSILVFLGIEVPDNKTPSGCM